MKTSQIRQHLHRYIDKAVDEQIKAIYTLLEANIEAVQGRISIEQYNKEMAEAEARIDAGEYYTQAQIQQMIK